MMKELKVPLSVGLSVFIKKDYCVSRPCLTFRFDKTPINMTLNIYNMFLLLFVILPYYSVLCSGSSSSAGFLRRKRRHRIINVMPLEDVQQQAINPTKTSMLELFERNSDDDDNEIDINTQRRETDMVCLIVLTCKDLH
jgi:hypothetical protein